MSLFVVYKYMHFRKASVHSLDELGGQEINLTRFWTREVIDITVVTVVGEVIEITVADQQQQQPNFAGLRHNVSRCDAAVVTLKSKS